jgi:glutaredoxin
VKEFLSRKGIPFEEFNVREDQQALQELLALRSNATPTVVIDGEVIVGFDPGRMETLLA